MIEQQAKQHRQSAELTFIGAAGSGKKIYVRKIALFGSCARDQATKSSDIDLAVQFSEASSFGLIGRLTVFLETLLDGRKVDLVERNRLTPEVLKAALREF